MQNERNFKVFQVSCSSTCRDLMHTTYFPRCLACRGLGDGVQRHKCYRVFIWGGAGSSSQGAYRGLSFSYFFFQSHILRMFNFHYFSPLLSLISLVINKTTMN